VAGVGIATVFRHFPTKAALLEAVLVRRFDGLRDQAAALLDAPDPGTAFFDFFPHAGRRRDDQDRHRRGVARGRW
jgi:AcrR family transcriptional regulator